MNGLTRAAVSALQPGGVARTHRSSPPYRVVSTELEFGATWKVLGHDGHTRYYAARASVLRGGPDPTAALEVAS